MVAILLVVLAGLSWQGKIDQALAMLFSGPAMALLLAVAAGAVVLGPHLAARNDLLRWFDAYFSDNATIAVLTDRAGKVLVASSAAAQPEAGVDDAFLLTKSVFAGWLERPEQTIYHLSREAIAKGRASTAVGHHGMNHTLSVRRVQGDKLLWQVHMADMQLHGDADHFRVPFLRISADGKILYASDSAQEVMPKGARHLRDIVVGPVPEKTGRVILAGPHAKPAILHRMEAPSEAAAAAGQAVLLLTTHTDPLEPQATGTITDSFLDSFPVSVARLKPDGTILYVNPCGRKLLGPEAVPDINLTSLLVGVGRPLPERLNDVIRGRLQGKAEMAQSRQLDADVFVQVSLMLHTHEDETSILAVFNDATELKTLEAQFVQSQKMQAVGQLAGGVAHDFNNLLTAIHGHCDLLLLRHESGDPDNGDLMQIRQNANRAAGLVRQLLAFSRKQTLRPKVLQLHDTLAELTHLLNRLLGERVSLKVTNKDDLWPVRVDERQLEQVIMNLVVNARDAMPDGGTVTIRTRNEDLHADMERERATVPRGRYIVIEVEDTGVGIPPDRISKIFEPFYTTKRMGEGTGLGLSTAYGIIKQTKGFIFARSTLGEGTRFEIYLTAHEGEDDTLVAANQAAAIPQKPKDLSGQGVVLLVEDEAPVRSFAARALQLRGYTVMEAGSGEEALAILEDKELEIDLFVSDVIMPGLDGPSWVRKAHQDRPGIGTVFVSGYAEDAFNKGKGQIPNASFLAKPFSLNQLTERVKAQMEA